ncbi:MAG: tyrosine-protein phosphatase [Acidobacteriia bacterium]|nr:tyrosine-protein phosphatase [Terriglobia bacterium]
MNFYHSSLWRRMAVCLLSAFLPVLLAAGSPQLTGVSNFQKVSQTVYRGAQPAELGFDSLAKLGIKTVVDLRLIGEHSQAEEQRLVEARGMRYVSVPMKGMSTPTDEQVAKVLALFDDATAVPVFVHCQRGADRTGAVIACYRIGHDRWDNKKALSEARSYGMSWYQRALQKYVIQYQPPQKAAAAASGTGTLPATLPATQGDPALQAPSVR